MSNNSLKIGFIGAGNMAEAIIKALIISKQTAPKFIIVCDINKKRLNTLSRKYKISIAAGIDEIIKRADIIMLAVKPMSANDVLLDMREKINSRKLIISIMTGISIGRIQTLLGKKIPVVRVMPNTPALLCEGACAYSESSEVKVGLGKTAVKILNTFCKICVKLPEKSLNIVTVLSGSGPAYFFYFAQAMLEYAKERDFDYETAVKLIGQTIVGAGKLILESKDNPEILRQKVASKGGTTERAINIMDDAGLNEIIKCALSAAEKRAVELGG